MNLNPTIIIMDFYLSQVIPLAKNLKAPKFSFATTNAWLLALALHTPTLDKEIQGEYVNDENIPISIPGCKPIYPHDLYDMLKDRTHRLYHEFVGACEGASLADGVFVNTFGELEPRTLEALGGSGHITKVPVYPIGPIVRDRDPNVDERRRSDVVEWLDTQEEDSVVLVSLGSGYAMTFEQIKEMALGLELSGKKFVWAVRPPITKAGNEHYFTAGEKSETGTTVASNPFPEEFYRVQSNGLVITDWAPQMDILKHPSIGAFVSHCGWNSVIESVSCGVPIIGWPLYAEQMMNATMLAEEVGNSIRVKVSPSTNMVGKEELAKVIRKIMDMDDKEGCVIRAKAKELKRLAQRAWSRDGSSYLALSTIFLSNDV
uniref:Anthocyanidin 3-O-glucosyltransferase 5 n=2 Tax=Cajanus cajan TaxID=3821 RepID=A0A151RHR5_CAJCA|nr:Anthocyanidin 3-O-glucosyltransferase 5 [Cajanus cajan]